LVIEIQENTNLDQDTRVQTLGQVALALLEQLASEQHVGSGAVAGDFVLRGGGTCDQSGGRVLNLL
jgi:hypothetical protein